MAEREYRTQFEQASSSVGSVVLPVALLLIVVAVLAGLVFGGVVQGHAMRSGPGGAPTTESTIVIQL